MAAILFPIVGLHLNTDSKNQKGVAPNFVGGRPLPAPSVVSITGVSRDSTGAALGNVVCTLFRVNENGLMPVFTQLATTISDGSGNYSFPVGTDGPYRVMFDIAGPARAGLTAKTLAGA